MPELMTDDDIGWLRDKLMLDYAEDQASNDFKRQIEAAYKNTRVKLNDVAHLLRHVGWRGVHVYLSPILIIVQVHVHTQHTYKKIKTKIFW